MVAHEVGHHVQDELGILGQANQIRAQVERSGSRNDISVRIELQADCLSGIWAREAARGLGTIERGDLEEAVDAARQIGDDTLQRNAGPARAAAYLYPWQFRTAVALVPDRAEIGADRRL